MIDPRPYKDATDSARAELDRQHAAADFAKIQSDRAERLKLSDAVSQEEQQNRSSDLLQSGARVKAAEAAVASAELNLSYTEVRSPINGRTSRTQVNPGKSRSGGSNRADHDRFRGPAVGLLRLR